MADFLIIFFKKIVYMNLNLLVATGLAYIIASRVKNPGIKYIIWSMVIVHFMFDLVIYHPTPIVLNKLPEHGYLTIGVGAESSVNSRKIIRASLNDMSYREISCGDIAVYKLGTEKTVYISFFIVLFGIYLIINNLIRYVSFRKKLLETFSEEITMNGCHIKFSDYINTPLVFGLLKPVIVLPLSLKCHCNEDELHAVINHEMAHIERKDHIIFTLLQMIKSLFIFIFPLGIAIKKLEETEEYICDRMAVQKLNLGFLGIMPLKVSGLVGILTAPLIHENYSHLAANSIPLLVLGISLFFFYNEIAYKVFFLIYIITNIWVWSFARDAYHIGASGVVYGLAAFLFVSGFLRRHSQLKAISFLVVFFYGGIVWGVFPHFFPDKNISWESHLSGIISGVILAWFFRSEGPQRPIYDWENEEDNFTDEESVNEFLDEKYLNQTEDKNIKTDS